MTDREKPQIVPTLVSSGMLVWSLALVALFGVITFLYFMCLRVRDAKAAFAQPVGGTIASEGVSFDAMKGWEAYVRSPGEIRLYRRKGAGLPMLKICFERHALNQFRALDCNPALVSRRLMNEIAAEAPVTNSVVNVGLTGIGLGQGKTGLPTARFLFQPIGGEQRLTGGGVMFYSGEYRFFVWWLAEASDRVAIGELKAFSDNPFERLRPPLSQEVFDRPVIQSQKLTSERSRQVQAEAERELSLWRLFADRAKAESTARLPAISHFRDAVRLLASVRRESGVLASEDFAEYVRLLERRRAMVREWFVQLDKFQAIGDTEAMKRQAEFIRDHATLTEEAPQVHRALDMIAELNSAQQGK